MKKIKFLSLVALVFFSSVIFGQSVSIIPQYDERQYQANIVTIYQTILNKSLTPYQRIDQASKFFLGKPYVLGALGEGPSAKFDKDLLFRTDAFDCLTLVSTVLALMKGTNEAEFLTHLKRIQYENSRVSYFARYHFVDLDWNDYNQKNGYIKDITAEIDPTCHTAIAIVNKPNWYKQLSPATLKVFSPPQEQQTAELLKELHQHASKVNVALSKTPFIPLAHLFMPSNDPVPNMKIFDQIPAGAIIEIVDKTHDFKKEIGTDLNVSHLGFAIRNQEGNLIFRHASKSHGYVIDVPLIQYLKKYYQIKDPRKVGIHIAIICKTSAQI